MSQSIAELIPECSEADQPGIVKLWEKEIPPTHCFCYRGSTRFFKRPKSDDEVVPGSEKQLQFSTWSVCDCEVIIQEAVEYFVEQPGSKPDEITIRYKAKLKGPGKAVVAEIWPEHLNSKAKFSELLISKGFLPFIGGYDEFSAFQKLIIKQQSYPQVRSYQHWGEIKPGEFLFENGLFRAERGVFIPADEEGRIETQNNVFIKCSNGSDQIKPPVFRMNYYKGALQGRSVAEEINNFNGENLDEITMNTDEFMMEFMKRWSQINGHFNVLMTFGYFVSSLFSEHLIKDPKFKGFPILFKFGEKGTGKSTAMDWLMSMYGYADGNRQSISKQNTLKGLIRKLSMPISSGFFLDDYRNHETNSNAPDLTSSILNWFHHIGTSMAKRSADNSVIDTPMRANVVMTGNDKPTDEAVLSRMVMLNYTYYASSKDLPTIKWLQDNSYRLAELIPMLFEHTDFKGRLDQIKARTEHYANMISDKGFNSRIAMCYGYCCAGIQTLADSLGDTAKGIEFITDEFFHEMIYHIRREISIQAENSALNQFLSALDFYSARPDKSAGKDSNNMVIDHRHCRLLYDQEVKHGDGTITHHNKVLAIHMPSVWTVLQENRHSVTTENTHNSISALIHNSKFFIAKSQQTYLTRSSNTSEESNRRCYWLKYDEIHQTGICDTLFHYLTEYHKKREKERGNQLVF